MNRVRRKKKIVELWKKYLKLKSKKMLIEDELEEFKVVEKSLHNYVIDEVKDYLKRMSSHPFHIKDYKAYVVPTTTRIIKDDVLKLKVKLTFVIYLNEGVSCFCKPIILDLRPNSVHVLKQKVKKELRNYFK